MGKTVYTELQDGCLIKGVVIGVGYNHNKVIVAITCGNNNVYYVEQEKVYGL